ncbi:DUF4333 domain-containing protein [Phytomonospora endophytica]|uniref:DUF4333 domain-containing protein n=1 Tax=Phytomonospora endophytica TaxID=714109 RepID=A0A841G181_9ACTN|nr:DUF4333 domain-containing protein [Phytomonospora endophytica]MBB6037920.1 hypothetical protein [Phytomonospora endophytica]GIG68820.1 hypothetical protein Pen01_51150 [Phytomonospora endophytica]
MKLVAIPLTFAALALTACGTGPASASGEAVAAAAADSLEKQLGQRPEIDCGTETVTLEEGKTVDCVLTDPVSGALYDTTVTITDVDGGKWKASVKVADAPRGGGPSSSAPPPSESPAQETLTVPASEVAAAVVDALEAKLGQRPEIDCGEVNLVLSEGRPVYCTLIDRAAGEEYKATVSITGIDGAKWTFTVQVAAEPNA